MIIVTKLKVDIETEGEVALAERELSRLCGDVPVEGITQQNERIFRVDTDTIELLDRLAYAEWYAVDGGQPIIPQQAMIERETSRAFQVSKRNGSLRHQREYLGHGIHKYKAKFFPRFARSLINITYPRREGVILDPFGGSGTTSLEAGLMGLESIYNDIDPLSCFISEAKVHFAFLPIQAFDQVEWALTAARRNGHVNMAFNWEDECPIRCRIPEFLRIKLTPDIAESIEEEASIIANYFASLPDCQAQELGNILLSHALSTKLSLRWVGTGDNRFALEVAHRDLRSVASSHLKRLRINHLAVQRLSFSERTIDALRNVRMLNQSADALSLPGESVDAIVTSPPYLPASSGRETYLRSRAPGIVALGLLDEQAIQELDATQMMGSVLRNQGQIGHGPIIPVAVNELVDWMRPQRARAPKAVPTLEYFYDLYRVGIELFRVLRPGGLLAMVVATMHTYYELTTRQVVRRFPFAEVLSDFYTNPRYGIGFQLVESFELELPKQDFAARPVSQHAYSETAIILQKAVG